MSSFSYLEFSLAYGKISLVPRKVHGAFNKYIEEIFEGPSPNMLDSHQ
jgi:hypothetical protein